MKKLEKAFRQLYNIYCRSVEYGDFVRTANAETDTRALKSVWFMVEAFLYSSSTNYCGVKGGYAQPNLKPQVKLLQ